MGAGRRFQGVLTVLALAVVVASLMAAPAGAQAQGEDARVARWADDTLGRAAASHRASGIAVAFVKDGKIAFLKGYGQADLARKPVDPSRTLFSLGSVTKTFTATAIAQLLERGAIASLDDPANKYLRRIKLPAWQGREITVRNLLDHRGGFDESVFRLATAETVKVPLASREILRRLPRPVRAPGEISVYSNVGYGVLGVMIEDITGLTYGDYIQRNILRPLGMTHSFIRYRIADPIATPGEYQKDGSLEPIPQNWVYHPFILPSAGLVSTAEDMAKFAIAHLKAERGEAPELMGAKVARLMHDRHTANAPGVTGFGMSLLANTWNGERVTENAGSGPGFQAPFILLPDRGTGVVVLIMGGVSGDVRPPTGSSLQMFAVRQDFLNAYLGPMNPPSGPKSGVSLERFAGVYRVERRPHRTVEAFINPGATLRVEAPGDGTLTFNGVTGYRETAPGQFWKRGQIPYVPTDASSDLYSFVTDAKGRVKYVAPYLAVDVLKPALVAPDTLTGLGIGGCVVCLTGFAAVFWRAPNPASRWAKRLAVAVAANAALIPLTLLGGMRVIGNLYMWWGTGHVWLFVLLTLLSDLLAALTLGLLVATALAWSSPRSPRGPSVASRLHFSLVALGAVALLLALNAFHFVGYHVP